jgi:hypothetical protein
LQSGLEESVRQQRKSLFGLNEINIEGKSTISLLIDEVRTSVNPPKYRSDTNNRSYIRSMFSKLLVLFYGPLTTTTTTLSALP